MEDLHEVYAIFKMASGNEVRSFIRANIPRNKVVLTSLQSCKLKKNLNVLEDKIAKVSSGSLLWDHSGNEGFEVFWIACWQMCHVVMGQHE